VSILLVLILLILSVFFLFPAYKKIKVTRERSYATKAELVELQKTLEIYRTASGYYETLAPYTPMFDNLVPLNPEPSSFLNKINYFSLKSNVFLSQANLLSKSEGVEKISLTVRGDFRGVESFFQNLVADSRLYQVESLKISKKDDNSRSNYELDVDIIINTYYE